jgi:type I restriction enzyme M protein
MNLAIRGMEGNLGEMNADTFHNNQHKDLKADYILANPPFNISDWGGDRLKEDQRWKYGIPPEGNANYAWLQHMIHHLSPHGYAGIVLANGSLSSNQGGEGDIRQKLIEADLVDCIVSLPGQLFYTTPIPASLWFLARSKKKNGYRDRQKEVLFIDARNMGKMVSRVQKEILDEEIKKISETYHAWRGEKNAGDYSDVVGFCKSISIADIEKAGWNLTSGRYVGSNYVDDSIDNKSEIKTLSDKIQALLTRSQDVDQTIIKNLRKIEGALDA